MPLRYKTREEARKAKRDARKRRKERASTAAERGYVATAKVKTREAGWPQPEPVEGETIYQARNKLLKWLGFSSYAAYLRSETWLLIKNSVWMRDCGLCVCGRDAHLVHHRNYNLETLEGTNLDGLVCRCRFHHNMDHVDERGDFKGLNKRLDLREGSEHD